MRNDKAGNYIEQPNSGPSTRKQPAVLRNNHAHCTTPEQIDRLHPAKHGFNLHEKLDKLTS